MAVAFIQEIRFEPGDHSTTNYDAVVERLGDISPDGLLIHTAGFDDEAGVFRIFDVWESQAQAEQFIQGQLMPIIKELMAADPGAAAPQREAFYELHHVIEP
jgi:hypothetical protein